MSRTSHWKGVIKTMAMKLNPAEKANDSIIRAYNKQIENAYRNLGYNNTVTQNLVNKAKSIFGANAMKGMKITAGYSTGQINKSTGEIYEIPQIQRNRANLANTMKAKALKAATQYTQGDRKGQYKHMYDVSKAYQKAINQARQNILKSMSAKTIQSKTPKQIEKAIKKELTPDKIRRQITENDLASEIFAAYEEAKEQGDDTEMYIEFAERYHNGDDMDFDLVNRIAEKRYETLAEKSLDNPESGITAAELNMLMGGEWTDISPF